MRHKTITLAAVTFLTITGITSASSHSLSLSEQARAFATCAGRLQALAVRQGALHDPQSETTRALQGGFESLLDAVLPEIAEAGIDPAEAKRWRASGWVEIAGLLRHAHDEPGGARAARARADMDRRIRTCTRMILAG